MSDNFNLTPSLQAAQLAGNMDPNHPGLTMADAVATNAQTQAQQEQLIQQATEKTKQSKIQTAADTDLQESGGGLAAKGLVPKDQAIGELKALLKKDGTEQADIDKMVQEAEDTWPEEMNAYDIRGFISALRDTKPIELTHGQAFQATKTDVSKEDENGDPLVPGQWYQAGVDGKGDSNYVRSAQPSSEVNHAAGATGGGEKEWQALGKAIQKYTQSTRGNMVMNTVTRAKQALRLLQSFGDNPSKQVLGQVYADVSSIMTGGVGTNEGTELASYNNILTDLNGKLGYYTGHYNVVTAGWQKMTGGISPLREILENLTKTLSELVNTAAETVKAQLETQQSIFRNLVEANPARFQNVIDANMHIVNAGLPAGIGTGNPTPAASSAAPAGPVPQYTVEE